MHPVENCQMVKCVTPRTRGLEVFARKSLTDLIFLREIAGIFVSTPLLIENPNFSSSATVYTLLFRRKRSLALKKHLWLLLRVS